MLIKRVDADAIERGEITAVIRAWKRPQAKVGGVYRTMSGWLRVTAIEVMPFQDVPDETVAAAGPLDRGEITARFGTQPDDVVHVLTVARADAPDRPDPGATPVTTEDELDEVRTKLARLDERSPSGPWTAATLAHIAAAPATRSADMAADLGRDQAELKADVRKLKRLGLTRPAPDAGYELTPRGQSVLDGGA